MKITYTVEVDEQGTKRWYNQNDKLHRLDGPAMEYADGDKHWYLDGKLHRLDGPAIEWADGDKWWFREGNRHRDDGPAIETADGTKSWYRDGNLHRLDGPAVEWANGSKYWYLDDVQFTEEQWRKRVTQPKCEGKVVEVNGVRYKLVAV